MRDFIFTAITLGIFTLCVIYVFVSNRVIGPDPTDTTDTPDATRADERRTSGAR